MEFVNFECHPEVGILSQEELDVVLAVVEQVLTPDVKYMAGTFILDGQAKDREAQCLLRFNLPEGPYTSVTTYNIGTKQCFSRPQTSDSLAEESIGAVLEWPKAPRIFQALDDLDYEYSRVPAGIYAEDDYLVLVLNADCGRFVMSCRAFSTGGGARDAEGYARMVLHLVAKTICTMRPADRALQWSVQKLDDKIRKLERYGPMLDEVCFIEWMSIQQKLEECSEPVFAAWKDWSEQETVGKWKEYFV